MSWQWPEEHLYRFWGQKVKFGLQTFYRFSTITPYPCGIQWWYWWYSTCVVHDLTRTSIWDQKVNGQGQNLDFKLFTISAQSLLFLSAYNDNTSYMYWTLPKMDLYWFRGQKVKRQGKIRTLNFLPFPRNNYIIISSTIIILHTWVACHLRGIPYWFWEQEVKT